MRRFVTNIVLLPLYKSLPYRGVRSCCAANAVLNSGSRAELRSAAV